jgi:hypothetical protein
MDCKIKQIQYFYFIENLVISPASSIRFVAYYTLLVNIGKKEKY